MLLVNLVAISSSSSADRLGRVCLVGEQIGRGFFVLC
jgi:hypothetical protein